MNGIINVYKEKDFTSHDVVAVVRKILGQKKVGHTGTLDPQAEGVLPVCVGKATKLSDYIMSSDKTYVAEVTLGITTTTQDHTGEITKKTPVKFDENEIANVIKCFAGELFQMPPMYSAIKVNGKKLYELAREGEEIERKARKIFIERINIINFAPPDRFTIEVVCSKGTYIRTLCADIGEKLGCGAHMSKLLRTRSGSFELKNAVKLNEIEEAMSNGQIENVIIPMSEAVKGYKKIIVDGKADKFLYNGCKIYDYFFKVQSDAIAEGETVTGFDSNGKFVGMFKAEKDCVKGRLCIKPLKIL